MDEITRELQGKRVLVTGAAGFIGSRLTGELLRRDAEVIALVDETVSLSRIEPLLSSPGLSVVTCSLPDIQSLSEQAKWWGEIDLVAHLAVTVPEITAFCEQSVQDITMNLLPTIRLLGMLGGSLRGFCFASSVAVYGRPACIPVAETSPTVPVTSYGATKLATEYYLSAFEKASNVPVTLLRYSIVYGPGEFGHRAVPNFLESVTSGRPPIIYGDGSELRDYVYIDDVVAATLAALAKRPSCVLNIASGQGYSTSQIAREILRLCHSDLEPEYIPVDGENIDLVCDISAAEKVLSYTPRTWLKEGLIKEIEWCQNRYNPCY